MHTTYDGKCASFNPAKETANKEPAMSKFVVEKLYRVHRNRLLKVEAIVDCHVDIPDFLTNQEWKKNASKHRDITIAKENEELFKRLAKIENEESLLTKASRKHIKRVNTKLKYIKNLNEGNRLRKLVSIQRENEHMMRILEKAQPQYSLKGCKEWYKHHEMFKEGRRTDPTGGHIMKGMKGLLPPPLPPLYTEDSKERVLLQSLVGPSSLQQGSSDFLSSGFGGRSPKQQVFMDYGSQNHSLATSSMASDLEPLPDYVSSKLQQRQIDQHFRQNDVLSEESTSSYKLKGTLSRGNSKKILKTRKDGSQKKGGSGSDPFEYPSSDEDDEDGSDVSMKDNESHASDISRALSTISHGLDKNDRKFVIVSKPIALVTADSRHCNIQVCASKEYDDNLYIRISTTTLPYTIHSERSIPIDQVYEIVEKTYGHGSSISKVSTTEDLQILRTLLIDLFKEADIEKKGYLTFDAFQALMEHVDLGISAQELRFVISEADENDNGLVEYDEFVPLAVDMIVSFRARNRARKIKREENSVADDAILHQLSHKEMEEIRKTCMAKIEEYDPKRTGLIRQNEFRRCLNTATNLGLSDLEVNLILQMLPRDPFARYQYASFPEILVQARFMTMKNNILETQGSDTQKHLLELCKEEERKSHQLMNQTPLSDHSLKGVVGYRAFMKLLSSSPTLKLSRLQVMVIMSEAHVQDGQIKYYEFVPVVAKMIELMFEPKTLHERAELIDAADLSAEALLRGMNSEEFENHLLTLFRSYDINHDGILDEAEFILCLDSLQLQLTKGEMTALMASADSQSRGHLSFEDFAGFFSHNLINLEREKHIRILQQKMHETTGKAKVFSVEDYVAHLKSIFELADKDASGALHPDEFVNVLRSIEIDISPFELDILISEVDQDGNGLIEINEFIPICAELLQAFKVNKSAAEKKQAKEEWAEEKAAKLIQASHSDIQHIVKYLRDRLRLVDETVSDPLSRYNMMQEVLRIPLSGLSRTEANSCMTKLFSHSHAMVTEQSDGTFSVANLPSHMSASFVKNAVPILRRNITTQELAEMVISVRKQSIMRNLIADVRPDTLKSTLIAKFTAISRAMKEEGTVSKDSSYLPISVCFKTLESTPTLNLSRSQIIAIISWADCHDDTGMLLNYEEFAIHAADVLCRLSDAAFVDNQTVVLNSGAMTDNRVMNGLDEKELTAYLEEEFARIATDEEEVTNEQLIWIVRQIPYLSLSEREALAITSAFQRPDGKISWKDFIPGSYQLIKAMLKERMVHRRVKLFALSDSQQGHDDDKSHSAAIEDEALSELVDLGEKFIDLIKVRAMGDKIIPVLPSDATQRKHSVVVSKNGHSSKVEAMQILKSAFNLPCLSMEQAAAFARASSFEHMIKANQQKITSLFVLVKVIGVEIPHSSDKELIITVIRPDGSIIPSNHLAVQLPAICQIDNDVARQFAVNLIEKCYFVYENIGDIEGDASQLKFKLM